MRHTFFSAERLCSSYWKFALNFTIGAQREHASLHAIRDLGIVELTVSYTHTHRALIARLNFRVCRDYKICHVDAFSIFDTNGAETVLGAW